VDESVSVEEVGQVELKEVGRMPYRQLRRHCMARGLEITGTTATLRKRLRNMCEEEEAECVIDPDDDGSDQDEIFDMGGIEYVDEGDPDFEYNQLISEIMEKSELGHWKSVTRKLKKLKKQHANAPPSEEVYTASLRACCQKRLHGARAAEPTRKIMEDMADDGIPIPADLANYAIQNCLGLGPDGTHQDFGGIDCALAMMGAAQTQNIQLEEETYKRVAVNLAKAGEVVESLTLMKKMVVELSLAPTLAMIGDVAKATAERDPEQVMNVLAFAKAAGFELEQLGATEEGRAVLGAGVIAAEKLTNVALGLRLLTAAGKAEIEDEVEEGVSPDQLVATSNPATLRASLSLHKLGIRTAIEDGSWQLAVKIFGLMFARSLKPSAAVWRNVVTCCAKAEKSRKATSLLLDWVKLSEQDEMKKPPLSVFNTVVNACEICNEQELTLMVLDAMKKTHETEGNIITFNIALKRLAKQGMPRACEGIIIGMLQNQVEPSVVSYTTAIAGCVAAAHKKDPTAPAYAYEWMKRMRSRQVQPNIITYNTALAACVEDGKLESTKLGSTIAEELMADVAKQLDASADGEETRDPVYPDKYTKSLARKLMKQLRQNWRDGDIDMEEAKATVRVPLLKVVDFDKSEEFVKIKEAAETTAAKSRKKKTDDLEATARDEVELEYKTANTLHRSAEV